MSETVGRITFGPDGPGDGSIIRPAGRATDAKMTAEISRLRLLVDRLEQTLVGASHALRSYQHGNASQDLARKVADTIDAVLKQAKQ
jgi:hypothetical protein